HSRVSLTLRGVHVSWTRRLNSARTRSVVTRGGWALATSASTARAVRPASAGHPQPQRKEQRGILVLPNFAVLILGPWTRRLPPHGGCALHAPDGGLGRGLLSGLAALLCRGGGAPGGGPGHRRHPHRRGGPGGRSPAVLA